MEIKIGRIIRNITAILIAGIIYIAFNSIVAGLCFLAIEEIFFSKGILSDKNKYLSIILLLIIGVTFAIIGI